MPSATAAAHATALPTDLNALISAHQAILQSFEELYVAFEHITHPQANIDAVIAAQEPLYLALLTSREALLNHRSASLDEVRVKGEFVLHDRTFDWDDIEFEDIIRCLLPSTSAPQAKGDSHHGS